MLCECVPAASPLHTVPQTDAVIAPTRQCQTIGAECYAIDPHRVPCEYALGFTRGDIPHTDGIVPTPSNPPLPLASLCPSGLNAILLTGFAMPGEYVVFICNDIP